MNYQIFNIFKFGGVNSDIVKIPLNNFLLNILDILTQL